MHLPAQQSFPKPSFRFNVIHDFNTHIGVRIESPLTARSFSFSPSISAGVFILSDPVSTCANTPIAVTLLLFTCGPSDIHVHIKHTPEYGCRHSLALVILDGPNCPLHRAGDVLVLRADVRPRHEPRSRAEGCGMDQEKEEESCGRNSDVCWMT